MNNLFFIETNSSQQSILDKADIPFLSTDQSVSSLTGGGLYSSSADSTCPVTGSGMSDTIPAPQIMRVICNLHVNTAALTLLHSGLIGPYC